MAEDASSNGGESRFLYGDAAAFPLDFNFLTTLKAVVECAGIVGLLDYEVRRLEAELRAFVNSGEERIADLNRFTDGVKADVTGRAEQSALPDEMGKYSSHLVSEAIRLTDEAKASWETQHRAENERVHTETEVREKAMHEGLIAFLIGTTFPLSSWAFSMRLEEEAVRMEASCTLAGEISAAFVLDPKQSKHWRKPPRVEQFAPGLEIQVGEKKKLFGQGTKPDIVDLDDYSLTTLEITDYSARIVLLRKPSDPSEGIEIQLSQHEKTFSAVIHRHSAANPTDPQEPQPDDRPKLAALWHAAIDLAREAFEHRASVQWVKLDERDVLDQHLAVELIERFVLQYRAIVSEIARRSPNPEELSLKMATGDGRREEVFVSKAELGQHLTKLPPRLLQRLGFAELLPEGTLDDPPVDLAELTHDSVPGAVVGELDASKPPRGRGPG